MARFQTRNNGRPGRAIADGDRPAQNQVAGCSDDWKRWIPMADGRARRTGAAPVFRPIISARPRPLAFDRTEPQPRRNRHRRTRLFVSRNRLGSPEHAHFAIFLRGRTGPGPRRRGRPCHVAPVVSSRRVIRETLRRQGTRHPPVHAAEAEATAACRSLW